MTDATPPAAVDAAEATAVVQAWLDARTDRFGYTRDHERVVDLGIGVPAPTWGQLRAILVDSANAWDRVRGFEDAYDVQVQEAAAGRTASDDEWDEDDPF